MRIKDGDIEAIEEVASVELVHGKIVIKLTNQVLTIAGKSLETVVEELSGVLK